MSIDRYSEVTDEVVRVFFDTIEKYFPSYQNLNIKLLFDLKKRINKGKLVFASIELSNAKLQYFQMSDENPSGFDYLLIIDALAWETAGDVERENIIRHELSHIIIDIDTDKKKLIGHDYNVFAFEVESGLDWGANLAQLVNSKYEAMKG